jgi:putative DNA primase/helicase
MRRAHCRLTGCPGSGQRGHAEDHAARVIRPRLEAAGADLRRIRVVDGIDHLDDNGDAVVRPVALPDDIYRIEQVTRELGAQLVIVDPLMAYLSARVKGTVDQDVRRALLPLRELAERTNAAVLVIRHFRKSREGDAINWGGGSIGIAGAARSILQVGKDPERADVRVLAHVASNYGPECPSLAYRIAGVQTKRADTSKVEWIGETDLTAEDLGHASQGPGRPATERTDAELWLQDVLEGGPVPVTWLRKQAESDGLSWRMVENAKRNLGIVAERRKDHWVWRLP